MEGSGSEDDSANDSYCYPLLHIAQDDIEAVGYRLFSNSSYYTENNISKVIENLSNDSDSASYILPNVLLDMSDARSEKIHTFDSAALLLIMCLLFLTVITIWVFKVRRFRVLHETGLSLIYGIAVGFLLQYVLPPNNPEEYYLAEQANCSSENATFQVGEDIILVSREGDSFLTEVLGKVFRDKTGNYIQQTLLFDPELFFFALLPPIIFYAGYSLQKRHFFRNLGSLLLYAFAGTTVSAFIIGGLMFGYSLSGAESEGSSFAEMTGYPIPARFNCTIIFSLLFGSLISATDPVTILAIFHDLHVDVDLYSLVFGESVMNDAVAIVLFRAVDEYNIGDPCEHTSGGFEALALFEAIASFIGIFFGSFVLGCAMGLATALLMKFSKLREYPMLETSMFVIMSYSSFLFAEFAQLTGIVAVLFCGITQSYYSYINLSNESRRRTKDLFELINFLAENFVFSYMGLSLFTYSNHQWVPGFILFSFIAIFAGRVVNIYILSFILNLGRAKKISFRFQHMLVFAGLRGAIAFALAIRNTQSEERQLIFTTTLCIVMVTVFVCGGLTTAVLQCLKIRVGVEDDTEFSEEGQVIPYDKSQGNWFVSKWSKFDKDYLVPIFTHHGRPLQEVCPSFCQCCVPFCMRCAPKEEKLEESESEEESEESEEEEEEDGENVISFRHAHNVEDIEEGDLGLGAGADGSQGYQGGGYMKLQESTGESTL